MYKKTREHKHFYFLEKLEYTIPTYYNILYILQYTTLKLYYYYYICEFDGRSYRTRIIDFLVCSI